MTQRHFLPPVELVNMTWIDGQDLTPEVAIDAAVEATLMATEHAGYQVIESTLRTHYNPRNAATTVTAYSIKNDSTLSPTQKDQ